MYRVFIFLFSFFILIGADAHSSLPDFTKLIKSKSAAVVKINTVTKTGSRRSAPSSPHGQQLPDIFRHFFEPRQMPERNLHSMGSGFLISSDGYLLTNNHVIEDADEIVVRMVDRREFDATVVGTDPRSDLALLKIEAEKLPYLTFANSDDLDVGEWVVAIGSPFGLDFSASAGIVSAIGRSIPSETGGNYVPFIQTDVAINPGNSGGPLFNLKGEVVGVNSQIYTRSGGSIGLSFAIPANLSKNVVAQLKDKGRVDRGWLGVVIQEVDKDLADSFGLKKPSGALISQMERNGPAHKSGLEVGDVIIEFDGMKIQSSSDLPHAVGATVPGEKVSVKLMRQGKSMMIDVVVGSLDSKSAVEGDDIDQSSSRLGVTVTALDDELRRRYHLAGGVQVQSVEPNSPAAKAGISPGDVIAQLGFEEITSAEQFQQVVKSLPSDSLLPIRFISNGRAVFRTIILEK